MNHNPLYIQEVYSCLFHQIEPRLMALVLLKSNPNPCAGLLIKGLYLPLHFKRPRPAEIRRTEIRPNLRTRKPTRGWNHLCISLINTAMVSMNNCKSILPHTTKKNLSSFVCIDCVCWHYFVPWVPSFVEHILNNFPTNDSIHVDSHWTAHPLWLQ